MFLSSKMHVSTNMNIKNKFLSQTSPISPHFPWLEGSIGIGNSVPDYDIKLTAPWILILTLKIFWRTRKSCCCCWVASVVSDSVRPHRQQPTRLPCPWDSPGKSTGVGCPFLLQCMKVKSESEVTQSCPTLSYPMDCSPPGPSVHGIFQARVLEWGAISFSGKRC